MLMLYFDPSVVYSVDGALCTSLQPRGAISPAPSQTKQRSSSPALQTAVLSQTATEVSDPALSECTFTVSQRPLGAPTLGPSAGNSPVAKNNSQTDDRLNPEGDHSVHVL